MNSTLKTGLVVALLVAGVFGVTVITQYSPTKTKDGDNADLGPAAGPPLTFAYGEMHFDPASEDVANRSFDGFFEVSDQEHRVGFWFRNPTADAIRVVATERSCSQCTSAQAALVSEKQIQDYAGRTVGAFLPAGLLAPPDLLSAIALATMDRELQWTAFDFEDSRKAFEIPAGASESRPTFGLISVGFKAKQPGPPKTVTATFEAAAPGGKRFPYPFGVTFVAQPPFGILPIHPLDVGDLAEGAAPRETEFFVLSTTRLQAELAVPVIRVRGGDKAHAQPGTPVPLTNAELATLSTSSSKESEFPVRVKCGYRVPVKVVRDLPARATDVGAFTDELAIAVPGVSHTGSTTVTGRITGLVKLETGDKIPLGTYNSSFPAKASARFYTEQLDLDLEIAASRCEPPFVKYTLEAPQVEGKRKYWRVNLLVPTGEGRKPSWEGVLFLTAKGPNGATIRLPVTGNGVGR